MSVAEAQTAAVERPIQVVTSRFVTIRLAAVVTGLTEKAIERMIESGVWAEGIHFRRRNGRNYVDMKGYEQWVEKEQG